MERVQILEARKKNQIKKHRKSIGRMRGKTLKGQEKAEIMKFK